MHGETPLLKWHLLRIAQAHVPTLEYGVTMLEAQIRLSTQISLARHHPVVYCGETTVDLSTFDRPISWNQHVTFGPPILECDRTLFHMRATIRRELEGYRRWLPCPERRQLAEINWP